MSCITLIWGWKVDLRVYHYLNSAEFTDAENVNEYLATWSGLDGFTCRKCGHDNIARATTLWPPRTRCRHGESPTAGTSRPIRVSRRFESVLCIIYYLATTKMGLVVLNWAESWLCDRRPVGCLSKKDEGDGASGISQWVQSRWDETYVMVKMKRPEAVMRARKKIMVVAIERKGKRHFQNVISDKDG